MRRIWRNGSIAAGSALLVVAATGVSGVGLTNAWAASSATINGSSVLQPIDGFGFSEAFGRTSLIRSMPTQNQQQVLDLLFDRTNGAGMSILRLGISSTSSSIQPTDPGGPNATPKYVWNGDDDGQVWLSKQAQSYGVSRFYANAWSAPGYMKDNGTENNGGTLCGLAGTSCASGDWRRAYANYLVQYTKFYAQEGIKVTDLAFTNEPNWTTSYSSMRFTPAQAVELTKVVGPVANTAGLKLNCCDAVNWTSEAPYSAAIVADTTANSLITTHTGHSYGNGPSTPLSVGAKRTWMSEWSPDGTSWNENWDDGSGYDGFTVAQAIHTALTGGNVNAYVYWYGISSGATRGFIQGDGTNYRASKRLWAMAAYSRYIRPGANRIGASTSDGNLRLSAYKNPDGTVVVVALNAASSATSMSYALQNTGITTGTATPYLTNSASSMAAQFQAPVAGGAFSATVPARSLVTYVIRSGGVTPTATSTPPITTPPTTPPITTPPTTTPTPTTSGPASGACSASYSQVNSWPGGYQGNVTVTAGGSAINGWTVRLTFPSGASVSQAWNGLLSGSAPTYTVKNETYNGALAANGTTSFGLLGGGTAATPALSCTSP